MNENGGAYLGLIGMAAVGFGVVWEFGIGVGAMVVGAMFVAIAVLGAEDGKR